MTAQLFDLSAYRGALDERRKAIIGVDYASGPDRTASANSITSPTAEWIKGHPRFLTDPAYYEAAMFGHHHALRCGLAADTPSYFAHVEYFIGDRPLPEGSARPCDQIMHDGQKWLVWDVTRDLQPIVVKSGRKVHLAAGTWTRLGDAVRRVLAGIEEQGR